MKKNILSLILFFIVTLVVVALIMIGNWVPSVFQKDTLRSYRSIEEVMSSLNVRDLYVPAYYPQYIGWPPDLVVAQTRPYFALLMHFKRRQADREALVITQSSSEEFSRREAGDFEQVAEQARHRIHGRDALLEVGTCRDSEACSRITWFDGKYHVMIFMRSTPFDVIRVAESMHQYGPASR